MLTMAGALVAAVGLWVLAVLADRGTAAPEPTATPTQTEPLLSLSMMLKLFSLLGVGVVLIMGGWLGWRYYRSIPAWKRRRKLPPSRR